MALCTSYINIVVSGAGSSNIDGTYVPSGTTSGFNNFIISGGSLNQIIQVDNQEYRWKIRRNPYPGASFTAPYYQSQSFGDLVSMPACPTDAEVIWEVASSGSNPVPTVTGTPSGPDCSIAANRCAFAAGGESGRSRFRRLYALGYV